VSSALPKPVSTTVNKRKTLPFLNLHSRWEIGFRIEILNITTKLCHLLKNISTLWEMKTSRLGQWGTRSWRWARVGLDKDGLSIRDGKSHVGAFRRML
jgi:hypothetical protein